MRHALYLLLVLIAFVAHSANAESEDDRWSDEYFPDGCNGRVFDMQEHPDGFIVLVGRFTACGGVPMRGVGAWNGDRFVSLGAGINIGHAMGAVRTVAVNEVNGEIAIGGSFTSADSSESTNIARWDGTQWTGELELSLDDTVWSLWFDSDGSLYAGGDFAGPIIGEDIPHIARWKDNEWHALGQGANGRVRAIAGNGQGAVCVGGEFTEVDGIAASRVACHNDGSWSPLASGGNDGVNNTVHALIFDGAEGLYVGGEFTSAGGEPARRVTYWDGVEFHTLDAQGGEGLQGTARTFLWNDGVLYIGGSFTGTGAGTQSSRGLVRWLGNQWDHYDSGPISSLNTGRGANGVACLDGKCLVGGLFHSAPGLNEVSNLLMMKEEIGVPVAGGADGTVAAVQFFEDETLVVGGFFLAVGTDRVRRVGMHTTNGWVTIGDGFDAGVTALAGTTLNNLYAGGLFSESADVSVSHIARFDGELWRPMGSGLAGNDVYVTRIIERSNGDVVVVGRFNFAGGNPTSNVAIWNGDSWEVFPDGPDGTVQDVIERPDGALAFVGGFDGAGGLSSPHAVVLDDSGWVAYDAGLSSNPRLNEIAILNGQLHAVGSSLWVWENDEWEWLVGFGTSAYQDPFTMVTWPGRGLVIGGGFSINGVNRVGLWTGSQLVPFGSGVPYSGLTPIRSIDVSKQGKIVVGGRFEHAFGKASSRIQLRIPDELFADRFMIQ